AGSTTDWTGLSPSVGPSRSATTRPTRGRPPRGALTRCPGVRRSVSGTKYENARSSGTSKTTSASSEAFPFAPRELEVVPGHALVLIARVAQQEGGVEGRHEHDVAVGVGAAAEPGDALLGAEERLRGEIAERQDHDRLDRLELRQQERVARRDLVRLGVAVAL